MYPWNNQNMFAGANPLAPPPVIYPNQGYPQGGFSM
jgi:hypothetical protein